jgi:hypothetical protein
MSASLKRVIENPTDSGDPAAYAMRNTRNDPASLARSAAGSK